MTSSVVPRVPPSVAHALAPIPHAQCNLLKPQVYSADSLELVRVVPSFSDEVNAAVWHPQPGHGIAYGTKGGALRLLFPDAAEPKDRSAAAPRQGGGGGEERSVLRHALV